MSPLQFSVFGAEHIGITTQAFLDSYNASRSSEGRIQVNTIPWAGYREELTQKALSGRCIGVSQVGATLINDLIAMNVLRPFSDAEVTAMGGQAAFSKIAWDSANRVVDGRVWAIPWMVDPRGFFYWRDMLQEAGVDEATAFQSFENFEETMRRLQKAGYSYPLGISTGNASVAGHAACSWVWGAGADFLSSDGKPQARFTEPAFLDGLQAYFRLAPYLPHQNGALQIAENFIEPFLDRQLAVLYGSVWAVIDLITNPDHPLRSRLGLVLPPGPPYASGSNLVIWKNTPNVESALQLIRYLTSREAQAQYPLQVVHLPARQEVLEQPPFSTDTILSGLVRLSNAARPFPSVALGGMLENLYCASIAKIWARISNDPDLDVKAAIQRETTMLARRYQGWVMSS